MCYDTETKQVPLNEIRAKERAEREYLSKRGLERGDAPVQSAGLAGRPYSDEEIVAQLFKFHEPREEQIPLFTAINQAAKNFAEVVLASCPRGADRRDAINLIRDARMTANAAIALNGLSL